MNLNRLQLLHFKNYRELEVRFAGGLNCLTGRNGAGKTNLLDAIHYLGFSKSFLHSSDLPHILEGEAFFQLQGWFSRAGEELEVGCSFRRQQGKQLFRNKKEYSRFSEHIGLIPMVISSPLDGELFTDGSEERRKFLNAAIAQYDRPYLEHLMAYNRVLAQRNALLRQGIRGRGPDSDTLEIFDSQLLHHGQAVFLERKSFIRRFQPTFDRYYRLISSGEEQVDLEYQSGLEGQSLLDLLREALGRDLASGFTSQGIHRDDLGFRLRGMPVRRSGSQGQQKSVLVSLKLAQYEFLLDHHGLKPLLLLDDIFDKLDEQRAAELVSLVSGERFGQIFISDTHEERMKDLLRQVPGDHALFRVEQGQVNPV